MKQVAPEELEQQVSNVVERYRETMFSLMKLARQVSLREDVPEQLIHPPMPPQGSGF